MPGKSDDVLGQVVLTSDQFAGGLQGDVRLDKGGKGGQDAFVTLAIQPPTAVVTAPPQYVQYPPAMVMPGAQPMPGAPITEPVAGFAPPARVTTVQAPPQYVQAGQQMVQYGSPPVGTMMGTPVATGSMIAGPVGTYTQIGAPGTTAVMPGAAAPAATFMMPGGVPFVGGVPLSGGQLKAGSITDDVFNMVDRNQDGVISRSEFIGALKGNIINASQNTRAALGRA